MMYYSVVVDGKRYAVTRDEEQAKNIANVNGGRVEEFQFYTPYERIVYGKGKNDVHL